MKSPPEASVSVPELTGRRRGPVVSPAAAMPGRTGTQKLHRLTFLAKPTHSTLPFAAPVVTEDCTAKSARFLRQQACHIEHGSSPNTNQQPRGGKSSRKSIWLLLRQIKQRKQEFLRTFEKIFQKGNLRTRCSQELRGSKNKFNQVNLI